MAKTDNDTAPGKTTIAPEVLVELARLTALDIDGVSRMGETPGLRRWTKPRFTDDGVELHIEGDRVDLSMHIILKEGFNLRQVSRQVQEAVSRAIDEMVGMQAGTIDIHISDIDYPAPAET